ncbi:hypothetical protein HBI26_193130 [Parastagonospora nodorum]|nr:hypothetical protein HBI26_193130 [Parastagonospora nodorum]KAH6110258.1 hypothetical protein HBI64_217860 [Parastagonospora nodorum]
MSHSILITGASGYLGGSLLAQLNRTKLPPHKTLYALVRSDQQAEQVQKCGAEPLKLNFADENTVVKIIVEANISIIFFLIDALNSTFQLPLIKALGELKRQTGQEVHFLHTSGAKIFSEHAGMPTDRELRDDEEGLFEMQKKVRAPHGMMNLAVQTNNTIIETAESYGVRSYILIPCIVYGEGEGFGNRISIQTTAVVRAAKKVGAVYDVNAKGATWPVCHIKDNTALYVKLLESILSGANPSWDKTGYYLASSGSVAWIDIYAAIARALAEQKVVSSSEVKQADNAALNDIALALGCPKALVPVQVGGKCTLKAERAREVGWSAEYPPEHIVEAADAEVTLILQHLNSDLY